MLRIIIVILMLNFYNPTFSSLKNGVVSQMNLIDNLSFNFVQTIDEKKESGSCIIKYPKKIWCKYDNFNKKIIVSNGKFLVIKTENTGSYYRYSLNKTPLEFLLDKDYLISKINVMEPRVVDNKYLNFTFYENGSEINIFFDKKNLYLVGWQTEDIYQNLTITFISSIKINQKINNKIFILPTLN